MKQERQQRLHEIQQDTDRPLKEHLIENSTTVTSLDQLWQTGLSEHEMYSLAEQVSQAIDGYNTHHPAEMLPKNPEVILSQLEAGLSVLIYSLYEGHPLFLYHGTSYEMFENGEETVLGTQILEFGSAITNEHFRAGYGLGTMGAQARVGLLEKYTQKGLDAFGLSTIKRMITGRVWSKVHAEAISFWEVPYLSFLTDTCEGSSERYGHHSCNFRRSPQDSSSSDLQAAVGKSNYNGYMPCTLIVTSKESAYNFDHKARKLHGILANTEIEKGSISVESYQEIAQFFEMLKTV